MAKQKLVARPDWLNAEGEEQLVTEKEGILTLWARSDKEFGDESIPDFHAIAQVDVTKFDEVRFWQNQRGQCILALCVGGRPQEEIVCKGVDPPTLGDFCRQFELYRNASKV